MWNPFLFSLAPEVILKNLNTYTDLSVERSLVLVFIREDVASVLSNLVAFLVESSRHLQQGAPLVQRSSKGFPLLLQLTWDLFDLLGRIVARLQQTVPHRHDAIYVYVNILQETENITTKHNAKTNWWMIKVFSIEF